MKYQITLLLGFAGIMACGQDDGKKSDHSQSVESLLPTTNDSDTIALLDDLEIAGDHIGSMVDDAIADTTETSSPAKDTNFSLADVDKTAKVTRYRACSADETKTKAIVQVKHAMERSRSFSNPVRSGETSFKRLIEKSRTWSREGGAVACAANGKHVDLKYADLQAVQLALSFKNERSRHLSYQNIKKGTSFTRTFKMAAEGQRKIKWNLVEPSASKLKLTATVESNAERSLEIQNKKGETLSFSSSVKTDPANPLTVVSERDTSSNALLSRTIVSGKKIATSKTGSRTETIFTNVKYVPNDGCYATSGKIEGSIFAKDAKEAASTFVIDFSGDTKTIQFKKADGTIVEIDYNAEGCEIEAEQIEDIANGIDEKNSAAEVTLKI